MTPPMLTVVCCAVDVIGWRRMQGGGDMRGLEGTAGVLAQAPPEQDPVTQQLGLGAGGAVYRIDAGLSGSAAFARVRMPSATDNVLVGVQVSGVLCNDRLPFFFATGKQTQAIGALPPPHRNLCTLVTPLRQSLACGHM